MIYTLFDVRVHTPNRWGDLEERQRSSGRSGNVTLAPYRPPPLPWNPGKLKAQNSKRSSNAVLMLAQLTLTQHHGMCTSWMDVTSHLYNTTSCSMYEPDGSSILWQSFCAIITTYYSTYSTSYPTSVTSSNCRKRHLKLMCQRTQWIHMDIVWMIVWSVHLHRTGNLLFTSIYMLETLQGIIRETC